VDHAPSNLLRRPAALDPLDDASAQAGVSDQLALPSAPIGRHQLRRRAIVSVATWQTRIGEVVPPELAKIVDRQRLRTRAISSTGTFAWRQRSILRRSSKPNCR
jgi:hypothetical protein